MQPSALQNRLATWVNVILRFVRPYRDNRRIRIAGGVLLLLSVVAWYWFSVASATLTIAGHHSFRQAEVSVWIDGDLKSKFEVSGLVKKRLAVFQKTDGAFARSLRVGAGDHTVRVRVHSLTDNTDVIRQCRASVEAGTESTVYVSADRSALTLAFASAPPKATPVSEGPSGYVSLLRSILMAIAGSALSATVGFLVQDFLKSRKAAAVAAAQTPTAQ